MIKFPLNLFHLKYFLDAVKHGSISASDETNHISQSAISQAIAKLEEGLGCSLLIHQPKQFKITDEGKSSLIVLKKFFKLFKKQKRHFQLKHHKALNLPVIIALH